MKSESAACSITFLPEQISIEAHVGDTVLDAALDNDIELTHDCGGNCACTTCHILVVSGSENLSAAETVEHERLATDCSRTRQSRLACQALLMGGPISIVRLETW